MPTSTSPLSESAYRLLLLVYPASFRREYGREMQVLFRDRLRELPSGPGLPRLWLDTLLDAARSIPRQHLDNALDRLQRTRLRLAGFSVLYTLKQEVFMLVQRMLGAGLLVFAAGNFVYDAANDKVDMGFFAILLMVVAAAVGGALLARRGRV